MRIYFPIFCKITSGTLLTLTCALALAGLLLHGTMAEALCIKDKKANLRQGPGKHYEKLWTVFKYMPFKRLKRKGDWLRVQDLDGDIYWVYRKLTAEKYMCAVIKNNKTNMRQGPGTKFPEVPWSPIDKYFSMKVLKIKNSWVHVEDSTGDKAWVYRPLVWVQ
jgi:SH3-like domain-containing protein